MSDAEFLSQAFVEDPYPFYRRWRNETPIWWSDHLQGWVISRYGDVSKVLVDYRTFGQSYTSEAPLVDALEQVPIGLMDPPKHTKVRGAIKEDFRRRPIEEKLGALVERSVDQALAGLPASGTFELKERYVRPIVREAIAALIEAAGGKITDSVSGSTSYVVAGEKPGGSKMKGAAKHNVPILDEPALRALIERGGS